MPAGALRRKRFGFVPLVAKIPVPARPAAQSLPGRIHALLEEPAVGRADDVARPECAREVRTADKHVGARVRWGRARGERRGGE